MATLCLGAVRKDPCSFLPSGGAQHILTLFGLHLHLSTLSTTVVTVLSLWVTMPSSSPLPIRPHYI